MTRDRRPTKATECPWCADQGFCSHATTTLDRSADDLGPIKVCLDCARDYRDWEREQENMEGTGYQAEGPYFADTMSGGCCYLGG